ncbi:hypothetical protein LZC95_19775 [Pendulispora brunnea]|uniref:CN hydrolase domain-containing protein n=1 Tax=Pendulispora brunnea TaxID=2905690 RepID=A0ABZ2KK65_9BACT
MTLRLQPFAGDDARILGTLTRDLREVGSAQLIANLNGNVTVFVERIRESIFVLARSITTPTGSKPIEKLVFCRNAHGELFPVDHVVFGPNGDILPRSTEDAPGVQSAEDVHRGHHLAAASLLRAVEREQSVFFKAREPVGAPRPALEPFEG